MKNIPKNLIKSEKLTTYFIKLLSRLYCAKSHLQERLPEIAEHAAFNDLAIAVKETSIDVDNQIIRIEKIFELLNVNPETQNCQGLVGIVEEAFDAIHGEADDPQMRDLSILYYLQNIESIEMTSFKLLNMAAPKLYRRRIRQLLKESFDEASEDLALFKHIGATYFA